MVTIAQAHSLASVVLGRVALVVDEHEACELYDGLAAARAKVLVEAGPREVIIAAGQAGLYEWTPTSRRRPRGSALPSDRGLHG